MLNENIRNLRKSKGLSQEEFAVKLNVVRQTVSKWERGLSVPDSDMLISISETLDTPVDVLLGETVQGKTPDDIHVIAEKLEVINLQLAKRRQTARKAAHWAFIAICVLTVIVFIILAAAGSPYQEWNYSDSETSVAGASLHIFEWIFVRAAPFILAGAVIGAVLTRKR